MEIAKTEARGNISLHASCGGSKSEKVTKNPDAIPDSKARTDAGVLIGGPIDRTP